MTNLDFGKSEFSKFSDSENCYFLKNDIFSMKIQCKIDDLIQHPRNSPPKNGCVARGSRPEVSAAWWAATGDRKTFQYDRGHVLPAILKTGVGWHGLRLAHGTSKLLRIFRTPLHAGNQLRGWAAGLESCAWRRD